MANTNPKLTAAMKEIENVAKKYDLMGVFYLADGLENGEFRYQLDSQSWSNFKMHKNGIHFKAYGKSDKENETWTISLI